MGNRKAIYLQDRDVEILDKLVQQAKIDYRGKQKITTSTVIQSLIRKAGRDIKEVLLEELVFHTEKARVVEEKIKLLNRKNIEEGNLITELKGVFT